jgi:outer membrane protein assembly factor BamB
MQAAFPEDWIVNPSGGDPLSAPVVAGGRVFVSLPEAHQVAALDAETGGPVWRYTVGGRIDTPPTIHNGLCLIGSRDGWVYCLRASDGALAWRFRAAPIDRRIVAYGQLESAWPVVGGVLVEDGIAYFVVGRSTAIDGGMYLYAADPQTGKLVWKTRSFEEFAVGDLLVSDGRTVSLGGRSSFDLKTGKQVKDDPGRRRVGSFGGLAGINLQNRSWHYSRSYAGPMKFWIQTYANRNKGVLTVFDPEDPKEARAYFMEKPGGKKDLPFTFNAKDQGGEWTVTFSNYNQIEAMALTEDMLFAAGLVDGKKRDEGKLWVISTTERRIVAEHKLAKPAVAEGLAVAGSRLYVATEDGIVLCFGE